MEIYIKRLTSNADSTLGALFINGYFKCFTLEDEHREVKVKHETRIPKGRYEIKFRTVGGFHARYQSRYGDAHLGMLELQDVPNFQYILIHAGNTDDDTSGCLLVGMDVIQNDKSHTIGKSRKAYELIYPEIAQALMSGDQVFITIENE